MPKGDMDFVAEQLDWLGRTAKDKVINQAYAAASGNVGRMRSAASGGTTPASNYTEEELKSMTDQDDKK